MASGGGRGIHLRQGQPILFDVSQWFANIEDVYALAVHLLYNIEPCGGRAYVDGKKASGGVLNPKLTAHDVLERWCSKSPETAYGGHLIGILEKKAVNPAAAEEFRTRLVPGA